MQPLKDPSPTPWRRMAIHYVLWLVACWFLLSFQAISRKGMTLGSALQEWVWTPVAAVVSQVDLRALKIREHFESREALLAENRRLRERLLRYHHLELLYTKLLKDMTTLPPFQSRNWMQGLRISWARVLIRSPKSIETHEILLDRGYKSGIRRYDPVILDQGMIGYIHDLSRYTSKAWLVTHPYFSAGAKVQGRPYEGVLYGSGERNRMILRYLPQGARFKRGLQVVTTGMEGVFLPNLPIGLIGSTRVSEEGDTLYDVTPVHSLSSLEWVLVLHVEVVS